MVDHKKTLEIKMEEQIEEWLLTENGYTKRNYQKYDKDLCLDPEMVLKFIYATQPDEWEKLRQQHGEKVKENFLRRLSSEIERRGTLSVLRKGVRDYGCHFDMFYPKPATNMNNDYHKKYMANMFSVTRQLQFSKDNNKSLDMVIFINGLPIITLELKDQLSSSGYTVEDAKKQYRKDRDPKEPLFKFKRCFVHFAVDEDEVYMTTKLEGMETVFLPFNKGRDEGAGNPDADGFRTEYLWKEIFTKEVLSDIIHDFLQIEDLIDDKGRKIGERLIFPRYHQLDAVRKIISSTKIIGPGKNYLIQHSAGSGKSNTIAWLCHQLASLHNEDDKKIYDSVIVVTDRRILDRQLQNTIKQFEQVSGVVERVDKHSKQLKKALETGKKIIITTIQKFPYIVEDMGELPGRTFAVVVDEAHSSQSGETSKYLKQALKPKNLEDAEKEDKVGEAWEDEVINEMESRGRLPNVSYFAFTATPKNKTFELFGEKKDDGTFEAFHLYTMKQAIEEHFILDVLTNYTTYKTYFSLLKKIEEDPKYDRKKATRLLRSFVDLSPHSINKKVSIIIEHFRDHVLGKIPDKDGRGQAKAMIVTRSRLHAVRYKLACDKYIREQGYNFKALVAFSGTVKDPEDGSEYTESGMNGFSEKQTSEEFKQAENKFLIVANKFQTGFDQPLLYAMYVDKKLSSIAAVQTLSRTNRIYPNKEDPIVLDFANEADEIEKSFEPYYKKTTLSEGTDPNKLYDLQYKLSEFNVFYKEDVDEFAKLFFDKKVKQDKLNPVLNRIVEIFCKLPEEDREGFKGLLKDFTRLYSFLSQVITFQDPELEKLYAFGRLLARKLPVKKDTLPLEVTNQVDMDALRIQLINSGAISPNEGDPINPASYDGKTSLPIPDEELLSIIIGDLNDKYGTEFSGTDKIIAQRLQERIESNESLIKSAQVNGKDKVKMTFDNVFNDELQDVVDEHFDFYKKVNDDDKIRNLLIEKMFEMVYKKLVKV